MSKNTLLENGYRFEEKTPKPSIISIMWVSFTLFFASAFLFLLFSQFDSRESGLGDFLIPGGTAVAILIGTFFLYIILKFIVTSLFCYDKQNGVKLKLLENNAIPVCACREALKTWQVILIYMIPVAVIHIGLLFVGIIVDSPALFFVVFVLLEIFMALDLVLVAYVIYIRIRYKPDYIAVNNHIYDLTLYSKSYVRIRRKKAR